MVLALLALLPGAEAATLTVCLGGTCDYDDLGAAIQQAAADDEIVVGDGTWSVNRAIDKNLTIRGQNPGYAFLDAPAGPAFDVLSPVDFTLEDLEFGPSTGSFIVDAQAAANLTLTRVNATDHNPEGHLIKMRVGGTLTATDCTFTGFMHSTSDGAVLWLGGGATGVFDRVTIDDAHATHGGAIYVEDSTFTLSYSNITGSSAITGGGAIYAAGTAEVQVNESYLGGNTTDGQGGHVFTASSAQLTLIRSTFEDGQAALDGGAIYGVQSIDECEFYDNTATLDGGAVHTRGGEILKSTFARNDGENGGALRLWTALTPLSIDECTFEDNQATGDPSAFLGQGGAINVYWSGDLEVRNSVFTGNTAPLSGGAIFQGGPASSVIDNCLFEGNISQAGGGGFARYYDDTGRTEVHQTTFRGNRANDGGAFETLGGGDVQVSRSVFCDNEATRGGGAISTVFDGVYETYLEVNNSVFAGNLSGGGAAIGAVPGIVSYSLYNNDILDSTGTTWGAAGTARSNDFADVRNNLFAWSSGAPALWLEDTTNPVIQDYNAWWSNAGGDLGGSDTAYGDHAVTSDPMLTDYTPGAACGSWDLTPLPGSPLIDGGDPSWTDADGSTSDIGITGGVDGTTTPGYIPSTGTGSGTGTGTTTGSAGGTTTGSWSTPTPQPGVDEDGDGYAPPWDCDDSNPRVHPEATEIANDNRDNDCDGRKLNTWLGGRACSQGPGSPAVPGLALVGLLTLRRRRD